MSGAFDYIVVGAGSAGCVTAGRLVGEHGARVLLLEQGPGDSHAVIRMPAGSFKMLFAPSPFVKHYASVPQSELAGRSVSVPQGNVVGGGSSVNVMAYTRGSRLDYQRWDEALGGGSGWDWEGLLPYFRRQEGHVRLDNVAHGGSGPLKVRDPNYLAPIAGVFLKTMQRLGLPFRDDFAGGDLHGIGYIPTTIDGAKRCSAADAFLRPVQGDARLTLVCKAQVTRLLLEGSRVIGVEYAEGGKLHRATASAEVVLAAGAFATPKLLMLSGIGPADHLREHGIAVAADLPGVGQNLQDHNVTFLTAETRGNYGYYRADKGRNLVRNLLHYGLFGGGPIASNGAETMGFVNLTDPSADPDIQLYCLGVMWPGLAAEQQKPGLTLMANLVKPLSRGAVRLRSADPAEDPLVDLGWLRDTSDEDRLLRALRYLREIAATDPLASIISAPRLPDPQVTDDAGLRAFIRSSTESNYHPVGTCRMGRDGDPMAVLDARLRLRGIEGLRVFDASMMPVIPSANTNATVMAAADKGVDLMMSG
ncbi:GMC family oxidoreductase [Novosphingobium sp. 9]|uniref:GMC family oxidoreductase n=1 Tax=Novosphingobium sp. 9 TaxID=2025349 RepID=UPI0021B5015C|nr:FAD-dependent oxidoreductase [Novosphingobium sp. 9]